MMMEREMDTPDYVASYQAAWDRRHRLADAYNSGVSKEELALSEGVAVSRLLHMVYRARKESRWGAKPPTVRWHDWQNK